MTEGVATALRGITSSTAPPVQMTPAANHAAARSRRPGRYLGTSDAVGGWRGSPLAWNTGPAGTASGAGASGTRSGTVETSFPRFTGVTTAVNRYPRFAIVSM